MSDERIKKLRRWATGKSVDIDMSLTWDDVGLLLGRIDELLAERDLLLAVVEAANKGHVCAVGNCIRCDALSRALDAYYANKEGENE